MSNDENAVPTDAMSLEGPDVEVPTGHDDSSGDDDASSKEDGLGQDGTIPDAPDGIAAGHTGEPSNFEPEEDQEAG